MSLTAVSTACFTILLTVLVIAANFTPLVLAHHGHDHSHDGHTHAPDLQSNTVVDTPSGKIRGSILDTWTNKKFLSFRGVPFAEPPTGNLRFKPPAPVKPWQGIKDATQDGKMCPQFNMDLLGPADEDCLNLNVYTKDVKGNRPVIVYFHPGAFFVFTAASFWTGPQYLLDQEIVLVTVNYRLDALGFLTTGDKSITGNNGLKDQVEALRWVQKHIRSFGGNPNQVTIAGYSAGSTSGFLHMLSPMSKGLFHQVIAMSAGVTSEWVLGKDPLKYAKQLASLFKCPTDSSEKMTECLKKVPARDINTTYGKLLTVAGSSQNVFVPVIEPDLGTGEERFLTDYPVNLIKKKQFHAVPVVTGVTEYEFISASSYVLNNETLRNELLKNFDSAAPALFGYSHKKPEEAKHITDTFKQFYFGNKPITENSVKELGEWYSDYLIVYGEHMTTKLLVQYSDKPVYTYLLKYKGRYSYAIDPVTNSTFGAAHHDDLIYLFYNSKLFPLLKATDPEAFMVKIETTFWKNFATTGNPTPDGSPVEWTPFTKNNKKYLNIDSQLTMVDSNESPFKERMKIWEQLLPVE